MAQFAITTAKTTTGYSPLELIHGGIKARAPSDLIIMAPKVPEAEKLFNQMIDNIKTAKANLLGEQKRQKHHADKHRRPHDFKQGQSVLLSTKNFKFHNEESRKLANKFVGPFPIKRMIHENTAQ